MNENTVKCQKCGCVTNGSLAYCDSCGAPRELLCPHCDHMHDSGTRFCPATGKSLEGSSIWAESLKVILCSFRTVVARCFPGKAAAVLLLILFGAFIAMYFNNHAVIPQWNISVEKVQAPRIDVVFALDSTGSMGDEIQTVKERIKNMAGEIKRGRPSPDVRFGLVVFRDKGDDYVVKSYDFSRDINRFSSLINKVRADGGGDTPESVNEALDVAVNKMQWDHSQGTRKLLFLIGDAGPHTDYNNGLSYADIARTAGGKGINIYTIGCSGIESFGQEVFREVASASGGHFDYLTYQVAYQSPSGETHYVLSAGGKSYTVGSDVVKDESWREGVSALEKRGKVEEVSTGSNPSGMPGGAGCYESCKTKVSSGEARNNLDAIMTNVIKDKAKDMGVSY